MLITTQASNLLKVGNITNLITKCLACSVLGIILLGCSAEPPPNALRSPESSLEKRQLQSKKFTTQDEASMLTAGVEVLQDMGFLIKEADAKLGVIVGTKSRETDNRDQRIALAALSIFFGDGSLRGIEKAHDIKVSLVTTPDKKNKSTTVRVNFQRQVFDMEGNLVKLETIQEPELYIGFFSKLSKAVFLEAHDV